MHGEGMAQIMDTWAGVFVVRNTALFKQLPEGLTALFKQLPEGLID